MDAKFIRNTDYYTGIVYEWNLPAGVTCPAAKDCKISVFRHSGKQQRGDQGTGFRCYAASAERFPGVREHRWENLKFLTGGGIPTLPDDCSHLRIHMSGDFFSQAYFDMWLNIAYSSPGVEFWAFTKSLPFWLSRRDRIPKNLILTASYGGLYDELIEAHNLKYSKVFAKISDVPPGMPIDTNDDYARVPGVSFALLDRNGFDDDFKPRQSTKFWRE